RLVPLDHALDHHAAGHGAELGAAEHVADLGDADDLLADLDAQDARRDLLHLVDDVIDDREIAQVHAGGLDQLARRGVGTDVEADDRGLGGGSQLRVGLGDAADARADHVDPDLVVGQAGQCLAQRLHRALHVGLDDQRQAELAGALAHLRHDVFHAVARLGDQARLAALGVALLGDLAREALVGDHDEVVAGIRHAGQAEQLDRDRRAGLLDLAAGLVEQRPHAAELHAADQEVALLQGALLDQHGRDRAAALVERGLDHHAGGAAIGDGGQFQHLGLQRDGVEQVGHVLADSSTIWMSPPNSSATTSWASSSFLTRDGSASDLSILLIATISGTSAAFACWIASIVCGITPSSAATTSTTMSVIFAPRARMDENAACPGVSRKLMMPLSVSTWYAPMCWVMPPASPEATLV